MRAFGFNNSIGHWEGSLLFAVILSPNPASTPRNVLSMSRHSERSSTKVLKPFCSSSFTRILKSMLEPKFARPLILIHANFCDTKTKILADGVLMLSSSYKQKSYAAAHG